MTQKELGTHIIRMMDYDSTKNILINIKRLHVKKYHAKIAMFAFNRNMKEIIIYYVNSKLIDVIQKHILLTKIIFYDYDIPYIIHCFNVPTVDKKLNTFINQYFLLLSSCNMNILNSLELMNKRYYTFYSDEEIQQITNCYCQYQRKIKLGKLLN